MQKSTYSPCYNFLYLADVTGPRWLLLSGRRHQDDGVGLTVFRLHHHLKVQVLCVLNTSLPLGCKRPLQWIQLLYTYIINYIKKKSPGRWNHHMEEPSLMQQLSISSLVNCCVVGQPNRRNSFHYRKGSCTCVNSPRNDTSEILQERRFMHYKCGDAKRC